MSPKPTPEEDLARLARLLAHPVRVQILEKLHDRAASASDLTPEIGASLGTVAYHFKLLADEGALKLRGTKQVRGATERIYELAPGARREFDGLLAWLGGRGRPTSSARSSGAAKKRAGAGKKSAGAGKKSAGAGKKSAGAAKKTTGAAKKSSSAAKKTAGAAKKSSSAAKKTAGAAKKRSSAG